MSKTPGRGAVAPLLAFLLPIAVASFTLMITVRNAHRRPMIGVAWT